MRLFQDYFLGHDMYYGFLLAEYGTLFYSNVKFVCVCVCVFGQYTCLGLPSLTSPRDTWDILD